MSELKVVSLEECLEKVIDYRGRTPKKLGKDWLKDGEYRAISANNVKFDGLIREESIYRGDEELYKLWMKDEVERGDILLTSEAPSGQAMIWNSDEKIILSQRLYALRVNKNLVDNNYLKYFIQSPIGQKSIVRNNSGSTVSGISAKTFKNIKILIPDLENQQAISKILLTIDQKIQINNQINQELEAMAKTLYDYWFVQFDFPDQNGKPYKSSGGKMVYHPELKREIPERWRVTKLNEVVDLISGYPFSSNDYVTSGKYKLYTIKNVQDGYTVDKVDNYLDFIPSNMSDECQLRRGDLIMSLTGNVGRVGMVYEDDVLLNQRVLKLNPINKTHKSFIYSFFRSDVTKAHLENMSTGTSQKNLSPIDIGNMMIPFPSESLLSKFVNNLNMLENNLVENQQLTQLRDWLLPMLMNGQVKVE